MFRKQKCSRFFFGSLIIAVGIAVIVTGVLPRIWLCFFLSVLLIAAGLKLICH